MQAFSPDAQSDRYYSWTTPHTSSACAGAKLKVRRETAEGQDSCFEDKWISHALIGESISLCPLSTPTGRSYADEEDGLNALGATLYPLTLSGPLSGSRFSLQRTANNASLRPFSASHLGDFGRKGESSKRIRGKSAWTESSKRHWNAVFVEK
jgi:hypothetical protein